MKRLSIIAGISAALFVGVFLLVPKKKQQKPALPPINSIAEEFVTEVIDKSTIVDEAVDDYAAAYNKGYNAFLNQMGRSDLVSEQKVYTAYMPSGNEEQDEEAAGRGYADGYHKASDSIYCPRFKDSQYSGN